MLSSFGKKKETANPKTSKHPPPPTVPPTKPSSPKLPLSKENVKHLEETKYRLFGFVGGGGHKKSAKIKELSSAFDQQQQQLTTPKVGEIPIKMEQVHQSSPDFSPSVDQYQSQFGFHPLKTFVLPVLNLPALKKNDFCSEERTVKLKRLTSTGEFNLQLRRAQIVVKENSLEENRQIFLVESINRDFDSPFVNGDCLSAVNGVNIQQLNKKDVLQLINQSVDEIHLTLSTLSDVSSLNIASSSDDSHLIETTVRGDLNLIFSTNQQGNFNENTCETVVDGSLEETNRVWLAHKDGFSAAKLIEQTCDNDDSTSVECRKVKIQIGNQSNLVEVDPDDIEKANPVSLDNAANLKELFYLNESSVLHLLRRRFANNCFNTFAGSRNLLTFADFAFSSFNDKNQLIRYFKTRSDDKITPHIFGLCETLYRSMLIDGKSKSIIFLGRSASGKTCKAKMALNYFALVSSSSIAENLQMEKFSAAFVLLESFGNCKTSTNSNASRFASLFTLEFDKFGKFCSFFVQCLLFENHRIIRRSEKENNFHVLSYFWHGVDQEIKNQYFLNNVDDVSLILPPLNVNETENHRNMWSKIVASFRCLKFTEQEINAIYSLIAALFHLATAGATKGMPSFKSTFLKPMHAQKAAQLLGVSLEDLQKNIFTSSQSTFDQNMSSTNIDQKLPSNAKKVVGSKFGAKDESRLRLQTRFSSLDKRSIVDRTCDGPEALEAFLIGLYREIFNVVVLLVNRNFRCSSNACVSTSICVVDCPGYQKSLEKSSTSSSVGDFSDFCYNYVNERLNDLFYQSSIRDPLELYGRERIDVDFVRFDESTTNSASDLIDRQLKSPILNSANLEMRSQEKRGIFWLLDEESIFPGATDESFVNRIFVHHGDRNDQVIKKSRRANHFTVKHSLGSYPVTYNVSGWLRLAQENPITRNVLPFLRQSEKESVAALFASFKPGALPGLPSSAACFENSSMRRATTVLKSLMIPQTMIKRNSVCSLFKLQMDLIVETVSRTSGVYFVHCFQSDEDSFDKWKKLDAADPVSLFNVPFVRNQMRSCQLLESVRLDKIGFPVYFTFDEFKCRYEFLSSSNEQKMVDSGLLLDTKKSVEQLLMNIFGQHPSDNSFKMGACRVFLKNELFWSLEKSREEKLNSFFTKFQSNCRTFLVKKRLEKRKLEILSIKCIQKNINKYMKVKSWPWWKLYVRVSPLVNVNRADEEVKNLHDELESLRSKVQRMEKSNSDLRLRCEQAELALLQNQSELVDERNVAALATEALDSENRNRIAAEKQLDDLRSRCANLTAVNEKMELQILQYKTMKNVSNLMPNGDEEDECASAATTTTVGCSSTMGNRINELRKEIEMQRNQLNQEKASHFDQRASIRKHSEKKMNDVQKENDELRESLLAQKKRTQKCNDEVQDMKNLVQQLTSRNADLEKKQKRFDAEMNSLRDETESQKRNRDRVEKEKHQIESKCFTLEQELRRKNEELEEVEEKYRHVDERQLSSAASVDVTGEVHLKKRNQELERKCVDLEAELDEMAGELLQVQANVTRLEMQSNKIKRDQTKEMEKQDEEIEIVRSQMQKKIKHLELQLEEEQDVKSRLQREIRNLETRLREAADEKMLDKRDEGREVVLRRNLRKTKALLKDAQLLVEHYQNSAPNRGVVKQLKNQLEDAQASRLALVKSKQNLENELEEIRRELNSTAIQKNASEERYSLLLREKTALESRVNDLDYEMQDILKKYKAQVQQGSIAHITLADQSRRIDELEKERDSLKEKLAELSVQMDRVDSQTVDKHKLHLAEMKLRDAEAKLELEVSAKNRLDAVLSKSREQIEHLRNEIGAASAAKDRESELAKRYLLDLQAARDQALDAGKRETDATERCAELTSTVERLEQENSTTVADLKLALRRIDDLETALREDDESGVDDFLDDLDEDDEDEEDFLTNIGGDAKSTGSSTAPRPMSIARSSDTRRSGSRSSRRTSDES